MRPLRFVMNFRDWCLRCKAYTEHTGWARQDSIQPSTGVCAGCQLAHHSA